MTAATDLAATLLSEAAASLLPKLGEMGADLVRGLVDRAESALVRELLGRVIDVARIEGVLAAQSAVESLIDALQGKGKLDLSGLSTAALGDLHDLALDAEFARRERIAAPVVAAAVILGDLAVLAGRAAVTAAVGG